MITIKNRKLIIPKEDRVIGTVSDNNSETRIFVIDRYLANGIDLAALTFGMDMEYEDGTTRNATYLTKEVTDEIINLTWGIVEGDVQKSGTMFVQITAFDYDGTVKWATIRDAFYVEPVIGTAEQYTGDLSAFQRMEVVLDQKLEQIEGFLEDIDDIEEAEAGRVEAENGRVSAEGDRVLAEEGRVEAESQREATFGTLSKEAEAWAVGTKDGSPVANTDPQYHNNSKYYAEAAGASAQSASDDAALALEYKENAASSASNASTSETNAGNSETAAAGSATSAETNALKAEGFSVGKQNNQDVTSGSPYFHNNAAYYAEQAAAIVGGHFVSYDKQPLAPADQKQVRTNIAAIGYAGFTSRMNTILPRDDSRDAVFTSSQEHFYADHAHAEGSLFWITIDEEVYLVVADQAIAVGDEIACSEVNIMNTIEDIYDKLANIYTKSETNTALAGKADGLQLLGDRLSLMSGGTEIDYVNITTGASSIIDIPEPKTKTYTYNGQVQTFEWDSIDSDHIALSGNTNTNAGSYTVTATLKNPADVWLEPDGTISKDPKPFAWTIAKAQGSFDLSASSVSVDADDPTATVNVTNIVGDGVISVTSDDPTVATAAYSNGVITITGLTTGSATVTATMADSSNYDGTSDTISVTATFIVQVTLTINGAKEDDIEIYEAGQTPGVDTPKATCTFATVQTSGTCLLTVPANGGTFIFVSKRAKALDNSGDDYSKSVNLTNSLSQTVNVMPDAALEWYGNACLHNNAPDFANTPSFAYTRSNLGIEVQRGSGVYTESYRNILLSGAYTTLKVEYDAINTPGEGYYASFGVLDSNNQGYSVATYDSSLVNQVLSVQIPSGVTLESTYFVVGGGSARVLRAWVE